MKQYTIFAFSALILLSLFSLQLHAQKYVTKNGHIHFYSHAPMEDIEADNHQVNAAYDAENGNFVFKVLMKSFEFEKALMQEHFNENYVHSDKYPNATFKGKIVNFESVDITADGNYEVVVEGDLSMHGKTNSVKEKGSFTVSGDVITGNTKFEILLKDYDIKIPGAVVDNISESIEITVLIEMKKL